jgi:hypothetical protein
MNSWCAVGHIEGAPNDYQIGEVRQGFVPPAKQEQTVQ